MSYQKEATTRVIYFTVAAVIAAIAGLIVGALVAHFFSHANHNSNGQLADYIGLVVFAAVCGLLVYKIDQNLTKRFNQNP